jgi:hypothetical protein
MASEAEAVIYVANKRAVPKQIGSEVIIHSTLETLRGKATRPLVRCLPSMNIR